MFALAQPTSLVINSTPAYLLGQLSTLNIHNVLDNIAAQDTYTHLAYLILAMAGCLLLSTRMSHMQIGPLEGDFDSGSAKNPNFYIGLFLIAVAIAFLLANPQVEPPRPQHDTPYFDDDSRTNDPPSYSQLPDYQITYPQPQCGDNIAQISPGTRFDMYPVFVDRNDRILTEIKTNFCYDAFRNPKNGMIQVASFVDKTRANNFRQQMEKQFGNAEVGAARPRIMR